MGDQHQNAEQGQLDGFGLAVPYTEMNENNLYQAIQRVLNEPDFAQKAHQLGSGLNDQINRPLDRAVWWLEYLLRHPEPGHMRSPALELNFFQYYLMDVFVFLGSIVFCVGFVIFKFCSCCCGLCFGRKRPIRKEKIN